MAWAERQRFGQDILALRRVQLEALSSKPTWKPPREAFVALWVVKMEPSSKLEGRVRKPFGLGQRARVVRVAQVAATHQPRCNSLDLTQEAGSVNLVEGVLEVHS